MTKHGSDRGMAAAVATLPHSSQDLLANVSVIIPTKDERENILWVISRIPSAVGEIIVIDSSTDNTADLIRSVSPNIRIIHVSPTGKGSALAVGFRYAKKDFIVMIDGDGSMDPREIPRFIAPLCDGYDVVKGSRILGDSEDFSHVRRIGNSFFVLLVNVLYGTSYTDLCYGYRAFKKETLYKLCCTSSRFEIETEQSIKMKKMGLTVCEIPSFEKKRISGRSNLNTVLDGGRIFIRILAELVV